MCRYLGLDIYQERLPVTVVSLELLQHLPPVSLLHHLHHLIIIVIIFVMYKHLILSTLSFRFLWVTQSTCCGAILQYTGQE